MLLIAQLALVSGEANDKYVCDFSSPLALQDSTGIGGEQVFRVSGISAPMRFCLNCDMSNSIAESADGSERRVLIEANLSKVTGRIRSLQGVNAGPLAQPQYIQRLPSLHEQYQQIGVDYVRTHDIWGAFDVNVVFPDMKADPFAETSYNFSSTDLQVKAIKSINAQVLYRLGYSWGGPNDVPSDQSKFADVCKHIVMHYNKGWANGFSYEIQYWEIWNEPDIQVFWKGIPEQYFKLYDTIARALRTVDAKLKVGGPGLAGSRAFLEGFLQFCKTNKTPLDFISWHSYPRNKPPYVIVETAHQMEDLLRRYGFENVENFLTEWNFSAGSPYPDELWNARGAAWTACALIYLQDAPISRAFRYRGSSDHPYYSLFHYNGTFKKPAYAFLAMKKMLETPVRLACQGSNNAGFAVLSGISNSSNTARVLISNFDADYDEFRLVLNGLPWREKILGCEIYLIDDKNDIALIEKFESPQSEPFAMTHKIKASSVYLISIEAREPVTEKTTARITATTSEERAVARGPPWEAISLGLVVPIVMLIVLLTKRRRSTSIPLSNKQQKNLTNHSTARRRARSETSVDSATAIGYAATQT